MRHSPFLLAGLTERFTGEVKNFEVFKVLVVRDESVTKTLMDTVDKKGPAGLAPVISVVKSWQPKSGSEEQRPNWFCLTEVAAQSVSCVTVEAFASHCFLLISVRTFSCYQSTQTGLRFCFS